MSKIKLFLVCLVVLAVAATGCGTTPSGGGEGVKGSAKYYKGAAERTDPSGYDLWGVYGEETDGYGKIIDEEITPESSSIKQEPTSYWEYTSIGSTSPTTTEGATVTAIYDGVLSSVEAWTNGPPSPEATLSDWNVDSPAAYKKVTDFLLLIPGGLFSETFAAVDLATAEGYSYLVPNKYAVGAMFSSSKLGKKISSKILQPPGWEDWPADHPYWGIEIYAQDLEDTLYWYVAYGIVDAKTGALLLFDYDRFSP